MVWWDERLSAPRSATTYSPEAHPPQLHATVDLDCAYTRYTRLPTCGVFARLQLHNIGGMCRELVVEAFQRRPQWRVTCISRAGPHDSGCSRDDDEDSCAPSASTSLLHWGEYERIDWEQVHSGGMPPCPLHPPHPLAFTKLLPWQPCTATACMSPSSARQCRGLHHRQGARKVAGSS